MLDQYQDMAMKTAVYPEIGSNPYYPSMGLAGEIAELIEKIEFLAQPQQPNLQGNLPPSKQHLISDVSDEIGDVMWFVATAAREVGISFDTICTPAVFEAKSSKDMFDVNMGVLHGRATRAALIACELCGKSSKLMRDKTEVADFVREQYRVWLESISYHMWALAHGLRLDMSTILENNIKKLADRAERKQLHGNGDKR